MNGTLFFTKNVIKIFKKITQSVIKNHIKTNAEQDFDEDKKPNL